MKIITLNLRGGIRILKKFTAASLALVIFLFSLRIAMMTGADDYLPTGADPNELVIVIDPGHGGEDPGAVGVNGAYEKDINLSMGNEVGAMLAEKGYRVVYTRTDDRMLYAPEENIKGFRKLSDLKNRLKIAGEHPGAILISIHMNSYGESKYSGLQGYYSPDSKESCLLAESIQASVKNTVQPDNNRTVKKGKNIYLLENYGGVAVLVECGFLTNPTECEKLCEKEYQKELSFSIVCGIIDYITKST